MTAPALTVPQRRGACPGLSAPMPTGDGLLVRLLPVGTIGLGALRELCAAAQRYGNGIVEITSRGSIQIRGLSAVSAPRFASTIAALGIAVGDGIPVLSNPLAGLDPDELIDAGALAAEVRHALAHSGLAQRLFAKISVTIDGGAALSLDRLAADVRLRAIADLVVNGSGERPPRPSGDPIGVHRLHDGSVACGTGPAFGHADANSLRRLAEAATAAGANGVRTAPGRALLIIGLAPQSAPSVLAAAEALGFIIHPDDPRRRVIACAGAPICASANIAARAIAPLVAEIAAPFEVHISGCAKGCAHPAPAALTVVGTPQGCSLIVNGTTIGAPLKLVASNELPATVAELADGGRDV